MNNKRERGLEMKLQVFLEEDIYSPREWIATRITDKAGQERKGDVEIRRGNGIMLVDEKAYAKPWDGCLVELIQDMLTGDLGWFYKLTEATHLICGYYDGDGDAPKIVYIIDWKRLRRQCIAWWREKKEEYRRLMFSDGGWGVTAFIVIPWEILLRENMAYVLWPKRELEGGELCTGSAMTV